MKNYRVSVIGFSVNSRTDLYVKEWRKEEMYRLSEFESMWLVTNEVKGVGVDV